MTSTKKMTKTAERAKTANSRSMAGTMNGDPATEISNLRGRVGELAGFASMSENMDREIGTTGNVGREQSASGKDMDGEGKSKYLRARQ